VAAEMQCMCVKKLLLWNLFSIHKKPHWGIVLLNSMEQTPSCQANSHSASREIPFPVWSPKVLYQLDPSLNQMKLFHILISCFF